MDPRTLALYNSEEVARRYRVAYEKTLFKRWTNRWERWRLARVFAAFGPFERLLDMPSGTGRMFDLARAASREVVEADWSLEMLRECRRHWREVPAGYVRAICFRLPFPDGAFDGVYSGRLNHHIDGEAERLAHVRELMRVSRRVVVFTFFDHAGPKNLIRRLLKPLHKKRDKMTLRRSQVRALAEAAGFRVAASTPLIPFFSGHRLTVLVRREAPPDRGCLH